MPRRRFAIITYDPDLVEAQSIQAGGDQLAFAILRALKGHSYAKERGLINVTVMDRVEFEQGPVEKWLSANRSE
jgi:hypothetical protein